VELNELKMRQVFDIVSRASKDENLSDEALYVYAVAALISDDDWKVTEDDIVEAVNDPVIGAMAEGVAGVPTRSAAEGLGMGRDAVSNAVRELEALGWDISLQQADDSGRLSGIIYAVSRMAKEE